jgi:rubrerythrin
MGRVATGYPAAIEQPGSPAESTETAGRIPEAALPEFPDVVDFLAAGSSAVGEYRCADCGYGAVVQRVLPSCPMCSGTVWERREPRAAHFPA